MNKLKIINFNDDVLAFPLWSQLSDEIKELKMSNENFARLVNIPIAMIEGRQDLDQKSANKLESTTGIQGSTWLKIQDFYYEQCNAMVTIIDKYLAQGYMITVKDTDQDNEVIKAVKQGEQDDLH